MSISDKKISVVDGGLDVEAWLHVFNGHIRCCNNPKRAVDDIDMVMGCCRDLRRVVLEQLRTEQRLYYGRE